MIFTYIRKLAISLPRLTRTDWSKRRVKVKQPNCYIPRYLLDGGLKKGHGKSGRNSSGKVLIRHKKNPGRKNYRMVDFMRIEPNTGTSTSSFKDMVVGLSFDPCRSALVAKVIGSYSDNYRLVLAATGMKTGSVFTFSRGPPPKDHEFMPGDTFPLRYMPLSSSVFNIETYPGSGGKIARCGGACFTIKLITTKDEKVYVTLDRKGRDVEMDGNCLASYGSALTNTLRELPLGKAGRARRYGKGPGGKTGFLRLRDRPQRGRKNLKTKRY